MAAQQGKVEIKGSLVEKTSGEPIEAATIRLLSGLDSTMKAGVASNDKGQFSLKNIAAGTYLLHVSFVGYEPVYQPIRITGRSSSIDLGVIKMEENSIVLGEAVVTAKEVEVKVRNDTVEYNADSYKISEGSMLEDLLKKMPGVEVSSDGSVTINGKQIKKVLVDGKEFFSDDPKVATKNLPAKIVDKVQTYDRKSDMTMMTGFDDGNEEAVINLTIRPGMKEGWIGNAYAGYGSENRYEGNMMLNNFMNNDQFSLLGGLNNTNNMGFSDLASSMFSDMGGGRRIMTMNSGNGITASGNIGTNFSKEFSPKLTLGGNVRFNRSDNDSQGTIETENIKESGNTFDYEEAVSNRINNNLGINLRLTWKPDSLTQVIFTPDFSYSTSKQDETDISRTLLYNKKDTLNTVESRSNSKGNGYNTSGRLEASRRLNDQGRVLSLSLSGGAGDQQNDSYNYSLTKYYQLESPDDIIDQQIDYNNKSYNYRGFVSWVEPLGSDNFLQLTYSYSGAQREAIKNAFTPDAGGNYNVLDSTYSKSSRDISADQRASVAFKSQREKYNYTIGFNVDPSYAKTKTFVGNQTIDVASRNAINYSPTLQFNYRPSREQNIRVDYEGTTSQPTMQQLSPVEDVSNPLNTTIGNPDLKPIYTNNLSIRIQNFMPEKQTALMLMANGSYTVNDVVSYTTNDPNTGKKHTTYSNINGNYTGNIRFMFNTPLKNKKFSLNNMAFTTYSNANSYIDTKKNTNKSFQIQDRLGINYRSDYADFGLNANFTFRKTNNTLASQQDLKTYNYGGGADFTFYLPANFKIESDINYSANSGYTDGYEQNEVLWNASLSKSFLQGNAATLRLKIYDILQQRSNISYSTTSSYTRYSEYNTLSSYFMLHFIYKFSIFKGGASMSDMRRQGPQGEGPGPVIRREGPPGGGG